MINNVVYFHSREIDETQATRIIAGCLASAASVTVLDDLCYLTCKERRSDLPPLPAGAKIVTPYAPRAVRWLLNWADRPLPPNAEIISIRHRPANEVLNEILGPNVSEATGEHLASALQMLSDMPQHEWRPWFPVIDVERCTNCGTCLGFCLFGVYEKDDAGQVVVAKPANCKNNCPACARSCPCGAIIFPKFPDAPINGEAGGEGQPVNLDITKLVDGDVIAALRERSQSAAGVQAKMLKSLGLDEEGKKE